MTDEQEQERFTVTVDNVTAEKIRLLAERMNCSPSKMASALLQAGTEDNEWMIKFVTSRVVTGLREALKSKERPQRGAKSARA